MTTKSMKTLKIDFKTYFFFAQPKHSKSTFIFGKKQKIRNFHQPPLISVLDFFIFGGDFHFL